LFVAFTGNTSLTPAPRTSWVVRWNGTPRQTHATTRSNNTIQVQADIAASDIAQPGFSEVSILDAATGVVYPVNAFFTTTVDVRVADFAYDSVRSRFYVTVPTGGARPNAPAETLVSIDATSGAIGPSLAVGSKPTTLAISDDSSYLYVYLSGSRSIARVALATFSLDIQFSLSESSPSLLSMAVMPGSPGTIAVTQSSSTINGGHVVIYDDGKSRSQPPIPFIAANLFFADSSTIVTGGYGDPIKILKVSSAGIVSATPIPGTGQIPGPNGLEVPLAVTSDTVFANSGKLYSLKTLKLAGDTLTSLLGITGTSGAAAFVPGRSRLLIGAPYPQQFGKAYLAAFDAATVVPLGRITFPTVNLAGNMAVLGSLAHLVTWGQDGVAFVAGQSLFFGHTPLAGPSPNWTAGGTLNAASATPGAIAPGEILSIFGSNLGPTPGRSLEFSALRRVSTNLGGTEVWFDGLAGTMLYADTGQVNVIAPFGLAGKSSTRVQIWCGGIPSAQITLPVVPVTPGIFTQDGSGSGLGALLNADGSLNTAAHPAPAGTSVTLFGTGGGVTLPASHDGVPAPAPDMLSAPVRVLLNGQPLPALYAGSAPGLVTGVLQVNFQIPAGFSPSPAVTLQIEVAGVASSSAVKMAVQ